MLLLSVLGTWSAAVAAGLIARRLDPAYGIWALWITGIASPLVFDAYLVIAHSIAAALAGFAFLGLDQALKGKPKALLYALPAAVCMVLLRSEGVLLTLALGAAIGLSAIRFDRFRIVRLSLRTASIGLCLGLLGTLTYVLDTRWAKAISCVDHARQPDQRVMAGRQSMATTHCAVHDLGGGRLSLPPEAAAAPTRSARCRRSHGGGSVVLDSGLRVRTLRGVSAASCRAAAPGED
jgi:hypothetical protein